MQPFSLKFEMKNQTGHYVMSGYFDENARMPFPESAARAVEIDLGQISGLTSYGVRTWCQWVKQIDPFVRISLHNCPTIFVKSFNSVEGFFTRNMDVKSFFVPYYSPHDDSRQDVLYVSGKNFMPNGEIKHPKVVDAQGRELEVDTLTNYFRFLDKK